jgi:hypothetical protein
MESRDGAYIMIEAVKSNHNICNKAGCVTNFGPKFQIILNCIIKKKPSKKNLFNTTGQVLKETPSYNHTCPSVHKFIGLKNYKEWSRGSSLP